VNPSATCPPDAPRDLQLFCPRRILIPLAASSSLALALTLTLAYFYDPDVAPPWLARYVGNPLCAIMLGLFLAISLYALLQALGLREEQQALACQTGGARRGGRADDWWRYLAGRPDGADPVLTWALRRGAAPTPTRWAPPGDDLLLIRAQQHRHNFAPIVFVIGVLPLLGFIGTVLGIAQAIGGLQHAAAPDMLDTPHLGAVLEGLAFAFDTTFVGLTLVIPAMLYLALLRARAQWVDLLHYQYLVDTLASCPAPDHASPVAR